MRYWLMKSEPEEFSIDDLKRVKREPWSGVRNYAAALNMRAMRVGERAFFYRSMVDPAIVGDVLDEEGWILDVT